MLIVADDAERTEVAEQASTLSEALRSYDERNKQSLEAAKAVLDGTEDGTDAEVQRALDEASNRLTEPVTKLAEAEQRAREYARSL